VTIRAQIAVARNVARGKAEIVFRVRVQPCSEKACLAPQTLTASLALEVL
jgi:hypothetical protein